MPIKLDWPWFPDHGASVIRGGAPWCIGIKFLGNAPNFQEMKFSKKRPQTADETYQEEGKEEKAGL